MTQYVDRACRESHVVENECAWIGYGDGSLKAAISDFATAISGRPTSSPNDPYDRCGNTT